MNIFFFCSVVVLCAMSVSVVRAQTKRALVIGLGRQLDPKWGKINGDKDVPLVKEMLRRGGFKDKNIHALVNERATKAGMVDAFRQLASSCKRGDVVYVHYSGHGQQMRDVHNDEEDGLDECWIPYDAYRSACAEDRGDKHFSDDEVNSCLRAIRQKIGSQGKLLVVIDACHSGDATRGDHDEVVRGVEDVFNVVMSFFMGDRAKTNDRMTDRNNSKRALLNAHAQPLPEPWVTISACKSDEVNIEMRHPAVGKLTYALYTTLLDGGFVGSNAELMKCLRKFVNRHTESRSQHPEMTGDGQYVYDVTDVLCVPRR